MDGLASSSTEVEEARIRKAYEKRQRCDARYSWFNDGHLFLVQGRERQLLTLLKQESFVSLASKRMLEIGCGTGYWLRELIKWGARPENVIGIDLLPDRVKAARELCPEMVAIHTGNAAELPFPNATFDLVLQSTVFTSILDLTLKRQIASEIVRVLKDDGVIIWYDYYMNNPRNPDVQGVKKHEIYQLFPNCVITLRRITLAPPLARSLAPYSWTLAHLLEKTPFLCTHYLGVFRKQ
jgi:ubiquinone/menaquinone biosynthesis C-methylase UbiE